MGTRLKMRRILMLAILVFLTCACGSQANSGDDGPEQDPTTEEQPEPRDPADIADDRCVEPERVWDNEEDDWIARLGTGYDFIDSPRFNERGASLNTQCVREDENRIIEPSVTVDARAFLVAGPDDGHVKMSTLLRRDLSQMNWARSEADYFDRFFESGVVFTEDDVERADEQTRVLVLAVYATTVTHTLDDHAITYGGTEDVRYLAGDCGTGFTHSQTYGGGFLAMADISSLSAEEQASIENLLAEHASNARVDIDAFAREYAQLELPTLSYWTRITQGLNFSELSLLGGELGALVGSLPQLDETLRGEVEDELESEVYRSSTYGGVIGAEQTPYTDEQIATTDLDADGVEQYTCFRDFTLEARSLLERANLYSSEALCRRKVFALARDGRDHETTREHYDTMYDRLSDYYLAILDAHDECEVAVAFEDRGTPCEVCEIPEEFDADSLEDAYFDMQR